MALESTATGFTNKTPTKYEAKEPTKYGPGIGIRCTATRIQRATYDRTSCSPQAAFAVADKSRTSQRTKNAKTSVFGETCHNRLQCDPAQQRPHAFSTCEMEGLPNCKTSPVRSPRPTEVSIGSTNQNLRPSRHHEFIRETTSQAPFDEGGEG